MFMRAEKLGQKQARLTLEAEAIVHIRRMVAEAAEELKASLCKEGARPSEIAMTLADHWTHNAQRVLDETHKLRQVQSYVRAYNAVCAKQDGGAT